VGGAKEVPYSHQALDKGTDWLRQKVSCVDSKRVERRVEKAEG